MSKIRNLLVLVFVCYAITSTIVYLSFLVKKHHIDFEPNHDLSSISHIYKSLYRVIFAAKYTGCLKFGHNHDQNLARVKANPLFTDIAAFSPKTIDGLLRTPGHSQTWTGGQVPGELYQKSLARLKHLGIHRLVVWGIDFNHFPNYGHTHQYIHQAWFRGLIDLVMHDNNASYVWEVCWFDETSSISNDDLADSIVFTSPAHGDWVSKGMPISTNTRYVIHGIVPGAVNKSKTVRWEVHFHPGATAIEDGWVYTDENKQYQFWNSADRILRMPWAADSTPWEIEIRKKLALRKFKPSSLQGKKRNDIVFVGTVWIGNYETFEQLVVAAEELHLKVHHYGQFWEKEIKNVSIVLKSRAYRHYPSPTSNMAVKLMQEATIAPALQGSNQAKSGYVPCRIFKSIAAGALGVSNNKNLESLFKRVYKNGTKHFSGLFQNGHSHDAIKLLLEKAMKIMKDDENAKKIILDAMQIVKEDHTYLARFHTIFSYLE